MEGRVGFLRIVYIMMSQMDQVIFQDVLIIVVVLVDCTFEY